MSRFLPTLNAQGQDTLDEKLFVLEFPSFIPGEPPQRISIDFTKNYQMSLAFSLPLFAGDRLVAGYKQANYNLQASRETVRLSEQETIFNVKRSFYGYLLAREFSAVAQEALDLAEKFRVNVKNLYEVGMASRFDLLRSEVQVANTVQTATLGKVATRYRGIVMIDYINQLIKRGVAILQGSTTRLRAVLLTALTTILGTLPMAFSRSSGSEFRAPMGVAIAFGLTTTTFLTLFIIPVLYSVVNKIRFKERKTVAV
ncbi:MAG: efflux RND transporter permease subunit [Candidatus Aminicenantes bacterium]|nr:efflux RND transporter permease subunit [Candidatus Aminicenantes bacterium]